MKKVLGLIFISVLFTGCGGGSIIDGIWIDEFGISKLDSGEGRYQGLYFDGEGFVGFDESFLIDSEEATSVAFTTDYNSYNAERNDNSLKMTVNGDVVFEYRLYHGEEYTQNKFKETINGKWISSYMGIEVTYFIDADNNEMEIFSLGESSKGSFIVERVIGNWGMLKAGGENLVLVLKDSENLVMKSSDNDNILFTLDQ